MAKRGKNKQGRNNLRQISYALFCSTDGHIPLFYDVYEGSRNDAKQFHLMLERFKDFVKELSAGKCLSPETTLIFDKGNNSWKNFLMLDSRHLNFVGSVKLGEHKDLAQISNKSKAFLPCSDAGLKGTKATRKLSLLGHKLEDRANGLIKKGKVPTIKSVEKQYKNILSRQYILAYRSQYIIEDVFKETKDRVTGNWWPINHWTDSNIRVHGLYCIIALLLRALLLRLVEQAGLRLSMKRVFSELDAIMEVVNICPRKRRQKKEHKQTVLTKTSELQQRLMSILAIQRGI